MAKPEHIKFIQSLLYITWWLGSFVMPCLDTCAYFIFLLSSLDSLTYFFFVSLSPIRGGIFSATKIKCMYLMKNSKNVNRKRKRKRKVNTPRKTVFQWNILNYAIHMHVWSVCNRNRFTTLLYKYYTHTHTYHSSYI